MIDNPESLNFDKTDENLVKYEMYIGIYKIIKEQKVIYGNSNGRKGKIWLALSPKWILDDNFKRGLKTKFNIAYWVNYGDDETYGWFSAEQIKEWLTTPELKLSSLKNH